ncbi:hypothetical protein P3102_07630 [Amycolatopsis sp. QT-25]|uniref:hypothetical protein n=1 Tax=Amycolatopsis sp. QT-25 TaxID=3034022 RepID=UPI0023EACCFB|nr:hypothetical protein [Amycolatopsis sp. QT-25]WET81087.1 hypothetical protein P3102_07630 [Amycolatopsis sp. QT-25]
MVDVVAVHGIWMNRSLRTDMHEKWLGAMIDGLCNIRSSHSDSLTLECVFYGHEYNDGKSEDSGSEYTAVDLECGLETDLVEAIAAGLLESAEGNDDEHEGKLYLPGALQKALATIQRTPLFEGIDSAVISFVKQVRRYLDDTDFRARVHDEVETAMAQSPRLVIGHSLGSVIAYDWLVHNQVDSPPAMLTIGSPLGLESIRSRLDQPLDRSRWPGEVTTWTNVAAGHDAVAMVKELAPLYHPDIDDQPCANPRKSAHSALSYLTNVRTARAIDKALG